MIDIKSLRIGNYVQWDNNKNQIEKINYITKKAIGLESDIPTDTLTPIALFKPIPLTEDILIKCRLNKDGILFEESKNSQFAIKLWKVGSEIEWLIFWGDNRLPKIKPKYLHQLQNLYYDLTGKELNINI